MAGVFIPEITSYLLDTINLTVTDRNGNPYRVPVTYHQPEGEFIPEFQDSLVTFFLYDLRLDTERLQSDFDLVVAEDDVANTVTVKEIPLPYRLYYQIDLWSEWNEDMEAMIPQLLLQFPPRTNLSIPSEDGPYDYFMELVQYKNADGELRPQANKDTSSRIFRTLFRYCIYAELDSGKVRTYNRVLSVEPNTQPNVESE